MTVVSRQTWPFSLFNKHQIFRIDWIVKYYYVASRAREFIPLPNPLTTISKTNFRFPLSLFRYYFLPAFLIRRLRGFAGRQQKNGFFATKADHVSFGALTRTNELEYATRQALRNCISLTPMLCQIVAAELWPMRNLAFNKR